jgi:hypothetical protein
MIPSMPPGLTDGCDNGPSPRRTHRHVPFIPVLPLTDLLAEAVVLPFFKTEVATHFLALTNQVHWDKISPGLPRSMQFRTPKLSRCTSARQY